MVLKYLLFPCGIYHSHQKTSNADKASNNMASGTRPTVYKTAGRFNSGPASKVYFSTSQSNAEDKLVLKSFDKSRDKLKDELKYNKMIKERNILQTLKESNYFPKLVDCFESKYRYIVVLKYVQGGDFHDYFKIKKRSLDESHLRLCIAELLHAINYLHCQDVVHLDIKLSNTLISSAGHVVITDFDSSVIGNQSTSTGVRGTDTYVAPEILNNEDYAFPADHWSLGIMILYMIYKISPYGKMTVTYDEVMAKQFTFPEGPQGLVELLEKLLTLKTTDRLGYNPDNFPEVEIMPYFSNLVWLEISSGASTAPFSNVHPSVVYMNRSQKSKEFVVRKSHYL